MPCGAARIVTMQLHPVLLLLTLGPALASCANPTRATAPPPPPADEASVKEGINKSFLAEDMQVAEFVERFEVESREVFTQRHEIVAALHLQPGMDVADIGAGTGLFEPLLCEAVGSTGTVYAVDISPRFIDHLRERAASEGLTNMSVVYCTEHSAELPERSVDLVFICDTYHHFEYPQNTMYSIHQALRPGGQLVVLDFERIPGVSREWLLGHVRAGKQVFRSEIEAAGFELLEEVEGLGLEENYFLRFRKR